MSNHHHPQKGITSLLLVIIVSLMALLIATTRAISGIQETKTGLHQTLSGNLSNGAEGCLEQGLLSLNANHSYTGGSLTLYSYPCTLTVTGSGATRTIRAAAQSADGAYAHTLEADVDWGTGFQVTQWREVNG